MPFLASACSAAAQPANVSAPAPTPTTTFAPQVVIYEPTPTLTPTAEPTPTATPIPPTSTPAATPTPSPDQIDPFTGQVVTDTTVLKRRPLLIKVANTTEVRPQAGLAQADVVVEHYAEGGITRFSALFLANTPAKVGSVRSCRLIDIELPAIFGSSLSCSGTSNGVRAILLQSNYLFDQDGYPTHGVAIMSDFEPIECPACPLFRVNDRPAPHNLFANPLAIWKELDQRGKNQRTSFSSWTFDNAPLTAGRVVSTVRLPYTSGDVNWMYDAPSGKWMRFEGLLQHTDAETGKQLSASNVIVLFVPHVYTSIQEDAGGSRSIRIELWGEGKLRLYRDGREVEGTWQRAEDSTYTLSFKDEDGKPLALKPGNTWLELAPLDFKVKD
jgi:hypothetical protein